MTTRMLTRGVRLACAGLAFGATWAPAAAVAQTPDAGASAALEEVVVTAQRRSERLQEVPIAISAVGAADLEALGAKTFEDMARTVPGLVFVPGALAGGGSPTIRGISSQVGAATVGYYIDDTPVQVRPQGFSGNADPKLFDIDRIEVLRGPQGTLFGASSMGGTIRFLTPAPSFEEWSGRVRAEYAGTTDGEPNYELGVAAGGPLAAGVALRGSLFYRRDGGYVDRVDRTTGATVERDVNAADTYAGRLLAEIRPAPGWTVRPQLYYQRIDKDEYPTFEPARGGIRQSFVTPQVGRDEFTLPSLTVEYAAERATLTSVTSYFTRDDAQVLDYSTLLPNLVFRRDVVPGFEDYRAFSDNVIEQRILSQELRAASAGEGRWQWLLGAFYLRAEDTFEQRVSDRTFDAVTRTLLGRPAAAVLGPFLPGDTIFAGDTVATEKQLAAFFDVTYTVTPGLTIGVGGRSSRSELEYERVTDGPANGGRNVVSGEQKERPFTPRAVVTFHATDDVTLYASAQRGFRVGGVNPSVPQARCAADIAAIGREPPVTFAADSLWSYEVGAKTQIFDRRATLNLSAYQIDWKDIQQLVALPGCGFAFTDNQGRARIRGAEVEAVVRPWTALSLGASVAYTDATFAETVRTAANPATGVRTLVVAEGDRVLGVPRLSYAMNAELAIPVAAGRAYVRGDHQFVGENFRTLPSGRAGFTAATYRANPYHVTSVRLGFRVATWDLALFGTNVSDARPVLGATTNFSPAQQTVRGTTLRPRTFGITIGRSF